MPPILRGPAGRPVPAGTRFVPAAPPSVTSPLPPVMPGARLGHSLLLRPCHDTPPRPRLGPRPRLRPAGALPRGHVLRELGMARGQPARGPGARALHDDEFAMAAVAAVPGVRGGHRFPARQGAPRGGRLRYPAALPRPTVMAAAAAVGVRHAGDRAAAVVLRGGREAAGRLWRRLSRVLGTLSRRRRQLLPG